MTARGSRRTSKACIWSKCLLSFFVRASFSLSSSSLRCSSRTCGTHRSSSNSRHALASLSSFAIPARVNTAGWGWGAAAAEAEGEAKALGSPFSAWSMLSRHSVCRLRRVSASSHSRTLSLTAFRLPSRSLRRCSRAVRLMVSCSTPLSSSASSTSRCATTAASSFRASSKAACAKTVAAASLFFDPYFATPFPLVELNKSAKPSTSATDTTS
mmetsp:Transcript_87298/g.169131  ORF Transcript_87298/g.169131 Transcript_87298/m.169131 type:complete len:213 (+) Transcript_87298:902-1540(+)